MQLLQRDQKLDLLECKLILKFSKSLCGIIKKKTNVFITGYL